jgi:hypothetical protein
MKASVTVSVAVYAVLGWSKPSRQVWLEARLGKV